MPISIYNYNETKIPFLIDLDRFLESELENKQYYYDNDWQNGPNSMLVMENDEDEILLFEKVKAFSKNHQKLYPTNEKQITEKKEKYQKVQKTLRLLELREAINTKHLSDQNEVVLRNKKEGVYNSDFHEKMFFNYRCQLNKVNIKFLPYYLEMNNFQRNKLFLDMFKYISTLFKHGAEFGYLSFLSHSQGFFSRMKNETNILNMREKFEKMRLIVFEETISEIPEQVEMILTEWKELWKTISNEMNVNFNKSNYDAGSRLTLSDQLNILESNISNLGNSFHKSLQDFHDETDFLNKEEVIIYRDIVNLFYLTLPLFEQSMIKKQFFAYSTVRYYEEKLTKEPILSFD